MPTMEQQPPLAHRVGSGQQHAQRADADADAEAGGAAGAGWTIDTAFDKCATGGAAHWLLLCYCGLSWLCDAMEVMLLSYLGMAARCEWNITPTQESLLTSVVFAGMVCGAPVWGAVSDAFGRRTSFALATAWTTVFALATAAAPNFVALVVFRAFVGFGIPAATVAFSIVLEMTPSRLRGLFAVGIEGFWTIGTMLQAGLAFALLNTRGWRLLVLVSSVPYVTLLLLLPLLPESPRWLLTKGKRAAAERVVTRMLRVSRTEAPPGQLQPLLAAASSASLLDDHDGGGGDGGINGGGGSAGDKAAAPAAAAGGAGGGPPRPPLLRRAAQATARAARALWASSRQILGPQLWLTTLVLLFAWVVAAFVYYGLVQLVAQVDVVGGGGGGSGEAPHGCVDGRLHLSQESLRAILITSSAELPALLFSLLCVHFLSRKVACAGPLLVIAAVLIPLVAGVSGAAAVGILWVTRFMIYASFAVLWTITPESYPTNCRSFALGVNNSFSRIGGLVSPFVVVNARDASGWRHLPEAVFAACSLLAAGAVFLLPPDRKNKPLDDTVEELAQRNAATGAGSAAGHGGGGGLGGLQRRFTRNVSRAFSSQRSAGLPGVVSMTREESHEAAAAAVAGGRKAADSAAGGGGGRDARQPRDA